MSMTGSLSLACMVVDLGWRIGPHALDGWGTSRPFAEEPLAPVVGPRTHLSIGENQDDDGGVDTSEGVDSCPFGSVASFAFCWIRSMMRLNFESDSSFLLILSSIS